ncbi:MAG: imidazole glycerol phosphate synthase subunit HisF [Armatimonadetes bacterium]|nr:imidazole glycerol phosphate synthase subunit HisF [Armatimonadota bacterium]
MVRPRLIPCLLLKHGLLVRSQEFRTHQVIGNPINTIMRLSNWSVDELILLDISREDVHDLRRDDLAVADIGATAVEVLRSISRVCFMPLTFGGRIRTVEDMRLRLEAGADKCAINTRALDEPSFVAEASRRFGAQCVVVSIDVKRHLDGRCEVFAEGGRRATGRDPVAWAREVEALGAGEIFLNSIDRDGGARGYKLDLVRAVSDATTIPLIACGGVGKYEHFAPGVREGRASAVAAANIFHFFELSYPMAKKACLEAGLPMRAVKVNSPYFPREPSYSDEQKQRSLWRLEVREVDEEKYSGKGRGKVRWCTSCVYPSISAAPLDFDENGVCTGCQVSGTKHWLTREEWERRTDLLRDLLEKYRCRDGSRYDCVIPVSGGKDSYFQTHVIKNVLGLNPLLVTYNGNNYLDVGWRNVHRMKEVFGVDHVFYSPSVDLLKKLNRLGFVIMGDMNWHAHVGITTLPVRVAAQFKVPLLIWGEHGYLDLSGQFSMDDFPEMSYRDRLEHFARAYEWNYMVGFEGIRSQDMIVYKYPGDQELYDLDLRGLYIGNYVYWEANEHTKMVMETYGFEGNTEPFDRTYRTMSNLDDMHENGLHDYLKYVKFGYGRATDHVCKDIRAGLMTRDEGVALVRKYDHVKPRDMARWSRYVGMSEAEFDRIADTFRDPRVWRREHGQWVKDNIWD